MGTGFLNRPREARLTLLITDSTAHIKGFDSIDGLLIDHALLCDLVAQYGDRMTSRSSADVTGMLKLWDAADVRALARCTVCAANLADANTHLRNVQTADANQAATRGTVTLTKANLTDLFNFDGDYVLSRALDFIAGQLNDTDEAAATYLSPAANADPDARTAFFADIARLRAICFKALADNGYGNIG